jgi:hypothetical protein
VETQTVHGSLRTPRAAAVAGIVFSVLAGASLVLMRLAVPAGLRQASEWVIDPTRRSFVAIALDLIPFAGIAFLWFIGVVRARIGEREDRFFASVFLGSGLLFVGMLFVSSALSGGLLTVATEAASSKTVQAPDAAQLWRYGRAVTYTIMTVYALRMAAVFTISTATIALQIGIMPRWIALLGYACALVLLVTAGYVAWIELVFPAWILVVSVYILLATLRSPMRSTS